MVIKTKAVGIRLPLDLIECIEQYQNDRCLNFTEALISLVKNGLGGDETESIKVSTDSVNERVKQALDVMLDERVKQALDVMLDERVKQALDVMLDTQNIPSDDLSNSDPVAEDVSIIPGGTDIENHSPQKESLPTFYSFADFHNFLGLTRPDKRNKANGDIAIIAAKEKGYGNWTMNTSSYKFTKTIED